MSIEEDDFNRLVERILEAAGSKSAPGLSKIACEMYVENFCDWSLCGSVQELKVWFKRCVDNSQFQLEVLPLNALKNWHFDPSSGDFRHKTGEFFKVIGVRTHASPTREIKGGWDQPLIEQVGLDGGILGLIRKKIDGIPHYLIEAKFEPGNPDICQISPTLQATFSNLKRAHGGATPHFADIFQNPDGYRDVKIIFDQWMSEDGGRLYKKRNRGMLIELIDSAEPANIPENFRWVSLYQLKHLIRTTSWVSPHIRSILSFS